MCRQPFDDVMQEHVQSVHLLDWLGTHAVRQAVQLCIALLFHDLFLWLFSESNKMTLQVQQMYMCTLQSGSMHSLLQLQMLRPLHAWRDL